MLGPLLIIPTKLMVVGPLLIVFNEPIVVGPLFILGLEQASDNFPEAVSLTMYISAFPALELSFDSPATA